MRISLFKSVMEIMQLIGFIGRLIRVIDFKLNQALTLKSIQNIYHINYCQYNCPLYNLCLFHRLLIATANGILSD